MVRLAPGIAVHRLFGAGEVGVVEPVIGSGQHDVGLPIVVTPGGVGSAVDIANVGVIGILRSLAGEAAPGIGLARLVVPNAPADGQRKNPFTPVAVTVQGVILAYFIIKTH